MGTKQKALIIGVKGTIGSALASQMKERFELHTLSREDTDYSEESLKEIALELSKLGSFSSIICNIGVLHNHQLSPEKRIDHLNHASLAEYFRINSILPALCLRFFSPLLNVHATSCFIVLSAMVGSIGDNRLGGWYGYRSSKAALNMLVKTAAIEIKRTNKQACVIAIHPGTTIGKLSKPFSKGIKKEKYFSAEQSAHRILSVADGLCPDQTGSFLNWDGSTIPF